MIVFTLKYFSRTFYHAGAGERDYGIGHQAHEKQSERIMFIHSRIIAAPHFSPSASGYRLCGGRI